MIKLRCHRRRGTLRRFSWDHLTACCTVLDEHLRPCALDIHFFLPVFTVIITSTIR